ncbi:winged helix-turn-helix domain-containing protein [Streptomyces sp. NPDC001205]
MVYRIHFTVEDLARTRLAQDPPPLLELTAATRTLQTGCYPVRFDGWRNHALARLHPDARMVLDLIPPRGWAPTFLASADGGDPRELLDRLRATPRAQIRKDLDHVAQWQPLPAWAHQLTDDSALLRQLFDSVNHVCSVLLTPHWSQITSATAADRGVRMRQALDGGMEHLLTMLHPRRVRWNPPVLELATVSGFEGDLHLEGRGLLLVPSVFAPESPSIDIDAEPQPVLRYPINEQSSLLLPPAVTPSAPDSSGARTPLASLLGRTRAVVLQTIAEHPGCSTKELAALTRLAPPSASEHTTTLRSAGLVRTARHRHTALHSPTALGIALLNTHTDAGCPRA